MGWFALPTNAKDDSLSLTEENGWSASKTKHLEPPFLPKLDRKWEILSILVPSFSVTGTYRAQTAGEITEHLKNAMIAEAWNPTVNLNVSFSVLQAGLPVGSLNYSQTLIPNNKIFTGIPTRLEAPFAQKNLVLADSLQNPIQLEGPESFSLSITYSLSSFTVPPFLYEYEEEAKTFHKEITTNSVGVEASFSFSNGLPPHEGPAMILYINESDKEQPNGSSGPTELPSQASSG